jgi:hypothetical protein
MFCVMHASRVNCALEKTNQSLSNEICRLKVISMAVFLLHIQRGMIQCNSAPARHPSVLQCHIFSTQEEIDSDKKKIAQLQKQVTRWSAECELLSFTDTVTLLEQLRANDENKAANQVAAAEKSGMFDGVAKIGRIAMRAFVNGSE